VQVRKPDDSTLAFLLGLALGVMMTLSVVELWVNNAMEHGWVMITAANAAGASLYYFLQPYFPEFEVRYNIRLRIADVQRNVICQQPTPDCDHQQGCAVGHKKVMPLNISGTCHTKFLKPI
jgi:hypothetical protein